MKSLDIAMCRAISLKRSAVSGASMLIVIYWMVTCAQDPILAQGQMVEQILPALEDTYVASGKPGENFGERPTMWIGHGDEHGIEHSLIKFDTHTVPGNVDIVSATMILGVETVTNGEAGELAAEVSRIMKPWSENVLTHDLLSLREGFLDSSTGSVAVSFPVRENLNGFEIAINPVWVQGWLSSDRDRNHGVMISYATDGIQERSFCTDEGVEKSRRRFCKDPDNAPQLRVVYRLAPIATNTATTTPIPTNMTEPTPTHTPALFLEVEDVELSPLESIERRRLGVTIGVRDGSGGPHEVNDTFLHVRTFYPLSLESACIGELSARPCRLQMTGGQYFTRTLPVLRRRPLAAANAQYLIRRDPKSGLPSVTPTADLHVTSTLTSTVSATRALEPTPGMPTSRSAAPPRQAYSPDAATETDVSRRDTSEACLVGREDSRWADVARWYSEFRERRDVHVAQDESESKSARDVRIFVTQFEVRPCNSEPDEWSTDCDLLASTSHAWIIGSPVQIYLPVVARPREAQID